MTSKLNTAALALLLCEVRADQDLSLREAARQIGVSASTLSRIEREAGAKIDLDSFLKVCDWLGHSSCDFIETDLPAAKVGELVRLRLALEEAEAAFRAILEGALEEAIEP